MRFRKCIDGIACEANRIIEEMFQPVHFHMYQLERKVMMPSAEKAQRERETKARWGRLGTEPFKDEDWMSADIDMAAHEERTSGGNPCAIIYNAHLNGKCPGEMGGVSEAEATVFVDLGWARPATDEEITAWFAQGCADDPAPALVEVMA